MDIKDVPKKIKNLRSTYKQEIAKVEKSEKSGSGADEIYTPSIKWFSAMDYIMKIINIKDKETTSNLDELHESTAENEVLEDHSEDFACVGDDNNTVVLTDEVPQLIKPPKKSRLKKKIQPEPSRILSAVNELKELNNTLARSTSSAIKEDECDIFGKHVAQQIRQLQPVDRIDATDEIQTILSRHRKRSLYSIHSYLNTSYSSSVSSPAPTQHHNECQQVRNCQLNEENLTSANVPPSTSLSATCDLLDKAIGLSNIDYEEI